MIIEIIIYCSMEVWKFLCNVCSLAYYDYLLPKTSNAIRPVDNIWYAAKSERNNCKLYM